MKYIINDQKYYIIDFKEGVVTTEERLLLWDD